MSIARQTNLSFRVRIPATSALALIVAVAAQPIAAQTAPVADSAAQANNVLDETGNEIVVTATKRGMETIQDVPISIQAITGDQLSQRGASDFNDFFRLVPGVSTQDTGPGDKRYIVRGINASGPGTVGVYLDEAIVTGENAQEGGGQQSDIKLFDIERVEVLKGPQGTTFGSSSLAGTIRYITSKPDLDSNGVRFNGELRSTKEAALGFQADGAVNVVIVPDRIAIRAAVYYADLPGYIDSDLFGKGVDGEDSKAARLSARFAITDALSLTVMAMYQDTHQDSKNYYNLTTPLGVPLTGPNYQQSDVAAAPFDDESQIYNATLEYRADVGTFTATASRFVRDLAFARDASIVAQGFLGRPYLGSGRSAIFQPKHRRVDSFEARYASDFGGPIELLFGVFAQEERRNFRSTWDTVNAQGFRDEATAFTLLDRSVASRIRERAVFGEVNFEVASGLKLTAGGRYYDFTLDEQAVAITGFGGSPGAGPGRPSRSDFKGFIPRFNIAYEASESLNLYFQAAKGFRAGGNNDQTAAALANVTIPSGFAPDSLWNYEVGVKSSFMDGRMFLNAAAYYLDWSNIQIRLQAIGLVNGQPASFPYTGNGGGADVKGFEAEFGGRPAEGLTVSINANYNNAKLNRTNAPPATGRDGDRLPYVPRWSAAAVADYEFPFDDSGLKGAVGGDITYTGKRATELNSTIGGFRVLRSNTLVALRAGVRKDNWSLMLIGSNIFNDQRVINYTATIRGVSPDQLYVNRPRTIALRLSGNF